jgi:diacylglycerol kinase
MHKRINSFKYALTGIKTAIKDEPNLKFHFLAMILVFILGFWFDISLIEWSIIILTVGFVITSELLNTAIEEIVDSFTNSDHPGAKKAKDVAAGAVLISSITASIIGLLIFLPYIF